MTGDEVTGDEVTGDEMTGDEVTRDEVTGDEVTGNPNKHVCRSWMKHPSSLISSSVLSMRIWRSPHTEEHLLLNHVDCSVSGHVERLL
ncbi:hemocyanin-like 1 (Hcl-1) [Biomphalaria glabrata]